MRHLLCVCLSLSVAAALSVRPCVPAASRDVGGEPGKPVEGGPVSPDGKEELQCPLPQSEKKKNVGGSDGAGLCVFTSIEYCSRYQNERPLWDFQKHMRQEPGGGWPEKVDKMMAKYAKGVRYLQSTTGDYELLKTATRSGRQCGVTYNGHDMHYSGSVAHMVTLAHATDRWACVTDNNFPGDNQYVWMSPSEFLQRHGGKQGWAVILLRNGPTPPPRR